MSNGRPKPGTPNVGDLSQRTAEETAAAANRAQQEAEEVRRMVQEDLAKQAEGRGIEDEIRHRMDPDDVADHQSTDPRMRMHDRRHRHDDEQRGHDLGMIRGDDRALSPSQWDRALGPSDPERRRKLRMRFADSVLPQLPFKEGMRRCWVSTVHIYDTPGFRIGIGYQFCTYTKLQAEGWDVDRYAVKDASNMFHGCVMWRELIAMETDEANWYMIMRELHHDQPYEQSRGIYEQLHAAGEQLRHMGGRTTMAPGMEDLRVYTRPPRQFM